MNLIEVVEKNPFLLLPISGVSVQLHPNTPPIIVDITDFVIAARRYFESPDTNTLTALHKVRNEILIRLKEENVPKTRSLVTEFQSVYPNLIRWFSSIVETNRYVFAIDYTCASKYLMVFFPVSTVCFFIDDMTLLAPYDWRTFDPSGRNIGTNSGIAQDGFYFAKYGNGSRNVFATTNFDKKAMGIRRFLDSGNYVSVCRVKVYDIVFEPLPIFVRAPGTNNTCQLYEVMNETRNTIAFAALSDLRPALASFIGSNSGWHEKVMLKPSRGIFGSLHRPFQLGILDARAARTEESSDSCFRCRVYSGFQSITRDVISLKEKKENVDFPGMEDCASSYS